MKLKWIVFFIIITFIVIFMTSCETKEVSDVKTAALRHFGIPIEDNLIQVCYKNRKYLVQTKPVSKDLFEIIRVIPVMKDPNNLKNIEIEKCNDKIRIKND